VTAAAAINIHATGIVLAGRGVVLRGPPGAGKSLLALELLERAALKGESGLLVADDRLDLTRSGGRILMHTPQNIAGRIELRGRGIVNRPHCAEAQVDLVIDLVDDLVRMLEEEALTTDLLGAPLPRCPVPRRGVVDAAHQLLLVGEALAALGASVHQKTT
jgi:serine kinase of HPr protein (carbohydrate metabolism regulator)